MKKQIFLIIILATLFFIPLPANAQTVPPVPYIDPEFLNDSIYVSQISADLSDYTITYRGSNQQYWFLTKFSNVNSLKSKPTYVEYNSSSLRHFLKPRYTYSSSGFYITKYFFEWVYAPEIDGGDFIWQPYQWKVDSSYNIGTNYATILSSMDKDILYPNADYDLTFFSSVEYLFGSYFNPNLSSTSYYDGILRSSGDIIPTGVFTEPDDPYEPTKRFYLEFRNDYVSSHTFVLESDTPCFLDIQPSPSATLQPFYCPHANFLYTYSNSGLKSLIYPSNAIYTNELYTPDAPDDYCTNIISSNYYLYSKEGSSLCKASNPFYITELVGNYTDPIDSSVIASEDWGLGEWFKTPFLWFVEIVNSVAEWFYNLWANFLKLIVPDPNAFTWFLGSLKGVLNRKFANVNLDSIEALKSLSPSQLGDITIPFRGTEVVVFNFDLLKDNMSSIRPVAISITGLMVIIFHINQISKIFQDREV